MPSTTGDENGKRTGQKMSHYILENDRFQVAAEELLATGFKFSCQGIPSIPIPAKKDKVKYSCSHCDVNAWAKPGTNLVCGECGAIMNGEE